MGALFTPRWSVIHGRVFANLVQTILSPFCGAGGALWGTITAVTMEVEPCFAVRPVASHTLGDDFHARGALQGFFLIRGLEVRLEFHYRACR